MIHSETLDAVILGAGIAGLSVADELSGRGMNCLILDTKQPGNGASAAPMLLANPATGRRAKITWNAESCLNHTKNFLERVQASSDNPFFEKNGVLRPALSEKIAADFSNAPEKYDWPADWISWLPKNDFSKKFPFFGENHGGLIIESALTIRGPEFIQAAIKYISGRNVQHVIDSEYSIQREESVWKLKLKNGQNLSTLTLIDATGFSQTSSDYWSFLALHPVKGQTATFHFKNPLEIQHSVSSLGYMAFMSDSPNQLTVGSTYEHSFDHLKPTADGLKRLKAKLAETFTGLSHNILHTEQWANVRVTVPDKQPVAGEHPDHPNLYLLGAFGSKGMMLGRYLAYLLAELIINKKSIDRPVSIERFL